MPPTNRYTAVDKPPISLSALATIASSTGCTSDGELAMTFNISAVAACCSRASFRSLLGSEIERRLTRVAAGAMRRLVFVVLRPFAALALRAFAPLFLPPVLDGRAISAPKGHKAILSGQAFILEEATGPDSFAAARNVSAELPQISSTFWTIRKTEPLCEHHAAFRKDDLDASQG